MKKATSMALAFLMALSLFAGCSGEGAGSSAQSTEGAASNGASDASQAPADSGEKIPISLWFWSAPAEHQQVMQTVLADKINATTNYQLSIEFRDGVDDNIATALAANQGPDIVYTSGPSYVSTFAQAGKLAELDGYAEQYGWKDRLIEPIYNSGTVGGKLYGLGNSLMTMGVFYNKKVLADNGWEVPQTIEDMEKIMDEAIAKGLYGSVTGNKGWKPVNANYSSLFLNHIAGPQKVYECLTGASKWNNPDMVEALNKSAEWYQKGYLGGENYADLNFDESLQLLAMGQSPFFVGPSNGFQWATNYFTGDTVDDLGFIPFPSTNDKVPYPTYTLGVTACLSINANTPYKDECAEILDYMMTNEFMVEMTKVWPGYWAIPLKELSVPEGEMTGLSAVFTDAMVEATKAISEGNFGFYSSSFFPPATDTALMDIDGVWQGTMSAEEVLDKTDAEFAKELEKGMVVPLPKPAG